MDAKNNRNRKKNKIHLVLICDETGIFEAFAIIKEHLGGKGEAFLTLIYSVSENQLNPLFEKEITFLEKRFSHNLFTYTIRIEPGKFESIQEIIEATINSNTNLKIQFLIYGTDDFRDYVSGVLEYLKTDTF